MINQIPYHRYTKLQITYLASLSSVSAEALRKLLLCEIFPLDVLSDTEYLAFITMSKDCTPENISIESLDTFGHNM